MTKCTDGWKGCPPSGALTALKVWLNQTCLSFQEFCQPLDLEGRSSQKRIEAIKPPTLSLGKGRQGCWDAMERGNGCKLSSEIVSRNPATGNESKEILIANLLAK